MLLGGYGHHSICQGDDDCYSYRENCEHVPVETSLALPIDANRALSSARQVAIGIHY